MNRQYREAALSDPVSRWLESQGYTVFAEVPFYYSCVDLVGVNWADGKIVIVELKMNLSSKVIHQGMLGQLATTQVYCGVGSKPRAKSIEQAAKIGLGVLSIIGGEVEVILEPKPDFVPHATTAKRLFEKLQILQDAGLSGGVGGYPVMKGVGPAQDVARLIKEYKAEHPKTTWRELFENVPNHYANYRSMQSAMYLLRQRLNS